MMRVRWSSRTVDGLTRLGQRDKVWDSLILHNLKLCPSSALFLKLQNRIRFSNPRIHSLLTKTAPFTIDHRPSTIDQYFLLCIRLLGDPLVRNPHPHYQIRQSKSLQPRMTHSTFY